MVPNQVTVIPIFLLMRTFGLIDTHLSIILPGLVSAFGVFMMRQFYLSLPQELIDAAKLDGAGPWRLYTRVALPLSTPALAALGIISFNTTWNSYFYPLIFLNSWGPSFGVFIGIIAAAAVGVGGYLMRAVPQPATKPSGPHTSNA